MRSRFCVSACSIATLLVILASKPTVAAGNQVVLIVGGDVEWALNSRPPTVRYRIADPAPFGKNVFGKRDVRDQVIGDWPPIPYIDQGESKTFLEKLGLKGGSDNTTGESLSYPLPPPRPEYTQDYSNNQELLSYPLRRLAPTFHAADLVFVNNEGALSDHGRQNGLNRTPEKFAKVMKAAGISIVNLANNHTFDAEERGFLDTLRVLSAAGIGHVGGGRDLSDARKPFIVTRNGIKLGFLGYSQFNNFGESSFAAEGRPGIVPMDPFVMKEDIRKLKSQVDYVLVAIHWATSRSAEVPRRTATLRTTSSMPAPMSSWGTIRLIRRGSRFITARSSSMPRATFCGDTAVPIWTTATLPALRWGRRPWKRSKFCRSSARGSRRDTRAPMMRSCSNPTLCRVRMRGSFSRRYGPAPLHWTRKWRSTATRA